MSTREKLYNMLDNLSEEQLEGLFQFLSNFVSVNKNIEKTSLSAVLPPTPGNDLKQSIKFFKLFGNILHQT